MLWQFCTLQEIRVCQTFYQDRCILWRDVQWKSTSSAPVSSTDRPPPLAISSVRSPLLSMILRNTSYIYLLQYCVNIFILKHISIVNGIYKITEPITCLHYMYIKRTLHTNKTVVIFLTFIHSAISSNLSLVSTRLSLGWNMIQGCPYKSIHTRPYKYHHFALDDTKQAGREKAEGRIDESPLTTLTTRHVWSTRFVY